MSTSRKRRDEAEAPIKENTVAQIKQHGRVGDITSITSIQLLYSLIQIVVELQREKRFQLRTRLFHVEHVTFSSCLGEELLQAFELLLLILLLPFSSFLHPTHSHSFYHPPTSLTSSQSICLASLAKLRETPQRHSSRGRPRPGSSSPSVVSTECSGRATTLPELVPVLPVSLL